MNDSDFTTVRPEIQVTLCREQNMGDHGERARIAHRVEPGETVEHLLMRLMEIGDFQPKWGNPLPSSDWIELRYVDGTAPEVKPEGAPVLMTAPETPAPNPSSVDDDPFTGEMRLCDDDGVLRNDARYPQGYVCTGHAHYMGEHIRCTTPAHDSRTRGGDHVVGSVVPS